jgi:hypothetical protein
VLQQRTNDLVRARRSDDRADAALERAAARAMRTRRMKTAGGHGYLTADRLIVQW